MKNEHKTQLKIIGENVRKSRENSKLYQGELAKKANISRPMLSNIENGGNARITTLLQIANALNITLEELIKSIKSSTQSQKGI